MNSKEYTLPNGKKAVFEYDVCGIGKITLECMDELMGMIADRPQGEWIQTSNDWIDGTCGAKYYPIHCSICNYSTYDDDATNYCPNCGCRMKGVYVKGADDEAD